jgi:hypothetical protein
MKYFQKLVKKIFKISPMILGIGFVLAFLFSHFIFNSQIGQRGSLTTDTSIIGTLIINKPTIIIAFDILTANIVQNLSDNDNGSLSIGSLQGSPFGIYLPEFSGFSLPLLKKYSANSL